jgi:hypothetical protein
VKECCHEINSNGIWILKDVTGIFHDQFEVICGLDQMIDDDVLTKFEVIYE